MSQVGTRNWNRMQFPQTRYFINRCMSYSSLAQILFAFLSLEVQRGRQPAVDTATVMTKVSNWPNDPMCWHAFPLVQRSSVRVFARTSLHAAAQTENHTTLVLYLWYLVYGHKLNGALREAVCLKRPWNEAFEQQKDLVNAKGPLTWAIDLPGDDNMKDHFSKTLTTTETLNDHHDVLSVPVSISNMRLSWWKATSSLSTQKFEKISYV